MSWHRGILVGIGLLVAAAAQAQPSTHLRAGVWRKLAIAPAGGASETVPELRVAPGSATLLHLPSPILPGGFTVSGGQARIDIQQVTPTTLVIVPATEVGPERVPLAIATADQRRYPFLMVTRPGVVDLEVSVVFSELPKVAEEKPPSESDIIEALLEHGHAYAREYEHPKHDSEGGATEDWSTPHVEQVVRLGNRYFIQVTNFSTEPWKVQQAKLEGATGILEIEDIHWRMGQQGLNRNVIVAKVPEGVKGDYVLTSIELVSEDARVAHEGREISLP